MNSTYTLPWVTNRPGSLNATTTTAPVLHSSLLDKWGALQGLYEAILNATLFERLVLMHLDTETPGVSGLKRKIESPLSNQFPEIRRGLAIVLRDEISHSRLGKHWLEYLAPDPTVRVQEIENTRLLRGVLLLTSRATHSGGKLSELAASLSA